MEDPVDYISKPDAAKLNRNWTEIAICPICKGSGIVSHRRHYGHTSGWVYDNRICEVCEGKGRLMKVISEQYLKLS